MDDSSSTASFQRYDSRACSEMRKLNIELGMLARMDGSAKFGFGSESAIASFHGPQEVGPREELLDRATLKVAYRPLEGMAGTSSKTLSTSLEPIFLSLLHLHPFPRTLIQLTIQSLSSPSSSSSSYSSSTLSSSSPTTSSLPISSLATALNASTLSILSSGSIPLKAIPLAISIAELPLSSSKGKERKLWQEDENVGMSLEKEEYLLVLDPTIEEEKVARSKFVFGWAFGAGMSQGLEQKREIERIVAAGTGKGKAKKPRQDGDDEIMDQDDDEEEQDDDEDEQDDLGLAVQQGQDAESIWIESQGDFDAVTFQKAYSASLEGCKLILARIRKEMLKKELKTRGGD